MAGHQSNSKSPSLPVVTLEMEEAVGVSVDALTILYVLDGIKGFGPQKFKQLRQEGVALAEVAAHPQKLALKGKRGDDFRAQLAAVTEHVRVECRERAARQIQTAHKLSAAIVTYENPLYPQPVYRSNNPIPVLYVRGARAVLSSEKSVACVGSRGIREPYTKLHTAFARAACSRGFAIASGFALGADTLGHIAAREVGGNTICCMPGGLDRPFPPENRQLWEDFLTYSGSALVSEFPFGTGASSLTLRKRNKLIVAFAEGVLVSQSSEKGGAMNAFRFAREQGKPVATFAGDGTGETSGNQLIADKKEERDAVFPSSAASDEAFGQWLRQLSSST
jgi:DNA protecting protein DprA